VCLSKQPALHARANSSRSCFVPNWVVGFMCDARFIPFDFDARDIEMIPVTKTFG
jgi:hypothetical protein